MNDVANPDRVQINDVRYTTYAVEARVTNLELQVNNLTALVCWLVNSTNLEENDAYAPEDVLQSNSEV